MYRSQFKYTPNPHKSPCFKTIECKHKQLTMGMCKKSCYEYNQYENIMEEAKDIQNEYNLMARYHQKVMEQQERCKR